MKRAFIIMGLCALVAIAATSCKKEAQTTSSFKATLTQPTSEAKTHLGSDSYLYWNEGDAIKVFDAQGHDYLFTTTDNDTTATFTGTDPIDVNGDYTAFYPAANAEKQGNEIRLTLPATQDYAVGTFGNATYPMAAVYAGNDGFTFSSPCGLLAIPVSGSGNISTIELTSRTSGEVLAGQLRYNLSGEYQSLVGTETTVTLNCGNLNLSSTATTFYFVLPAGVFANGFTAVLKNGTTELYTLEAKQTGVNTIAAQSIKLMPEVEVQAIAVTTDAATGISKTAATLNGSYELPTTAQGMNVTEVGFYFGTDASAMTATQATLETPFSLTKTGLTAGTTYYYKAYAKNGTHEYEGEVKNFTTLAAPAATTGTTGHEEPTISSTTAVCYGELASLSGITEYGICWSTENFSFSKDASVTYVASTNWEGGVFSATIPVAANGTYYYCAYAINAVGTGYGEIKTFTVTWNGNLAELTGSEPAGYATATDGMTIYGILNANVKVSIAAGASVTLSDATITGTNSDSYKWAGITCLGDATIELADGTTNNVTSFYEDYPGIYIAPGKTLTIQGSGTLNASSNGGVNGWGAGIGGSDLVDCGNIVIKSGTINATGGIWMAGIGGGFGMNCGSITINGGNVTATGGRGAAGIGTGASQVNITCGDISITGGIVNATGGRGAAGIGSGFVTYNGIHNTCGNISITGGQVTATGGDGGDHVSPDIFNDGWANYTYYGAAGIGTGSTVNDSGSNAGSSSCGYISITGGQVTATKGGGTRPATNSIGKNESSYNHGTCGTITIGGTNYGTSGVTPNRPDGKTFVYPLPEGVINGLFSVSSTKQVYFSKGSLQYIGSASTPYWKFADNQWDLLSTTNQHTNNTNVDRDIFSWGTSGYPHGATFYQPWEHGSNNNQFYAYGDIANYLSASTGKADWGYNAISNGGNQEHLWYTLDKDEWTYLLINRPGSTVNGTDNARYARATVEGINGVILFPDIYTHPADVNQPNYINSNSGGWANTYTAADFMKMEAHGAVFLPAGGGYVGGNIVNRNAAVFYWSSQPDNDGNALGLYLNNNSINCANSMYRHLGIGVRLVKDAE